MDKARSPSREGIRDDRTEKLRGRCIYETGSSQTLSKFQWLLMLNTPTPRLGSLNARCSDVSACMEGTFATRWAFRLATMQRFSSIKLVSERNCHSRHGGARLLWWCYPAHPLALHAFFPCGAGAFRAWRWRIDRILWGWNLRQG